MAARAASGTSACAKRCAAQWSSWLSTSSSSRMRRCSAVAPEGPAAAPRLAVRRQARNAAKERGHGSCGAKSAISDGMGLYGRVDGAEDPGVLRGWPRWRAQAAQQPGRGQQRRARRDGPEPQRVPPELRDQEQHFGPPVADKRPCARQPGRGRATRHVRKLRSAVQARPAQRASHRLCDVRACAGQEGRVSSPGAPVEATCVPISVPGLHAWPCAGRLASG